MGSDEADPYIGGVKVRMKKDSGSPESQFWLDSQVFFL